MGELASPGQLRMALLRVALVTVPLVLLLGLASGQVADAGYGNRWFASLAKPAMTPPGWGFAAAWTILYALQGLALAVVVQARGAPLRRAAVIAFVVQLVLNLAWSPLFFGAHRIGAALALIAVIFVAAALATWLFARVRPSAAALMLPYLAWLLFAGFLNYQFLALNPDAATLAPAGSSTQITL